MMDEASHIHSPTAEGLDALEADWQALTQSGYDRARRRGFADKAERLADLATEQLQSLRAAKPDKPSLALVLGLHHANLADAARGRGTVDTISDEGWRTIHGHLAAAAPYLDQAVADGFGPGMALAARMRAEQIQGSRTAAERLFEEVLRKDPHWLPAWLQILGVREPRWGGAVKDMDALLTLAETHLDPADRLALRAQYWWWRGNYAATWEGEPEAGLNLLDKGLALPLDGEDRAMLLREKGAILYRQDRDAEAVAVTREAVGLHRTARSLQELGERAYWAGDLATAVVAWQDGSWLEGEDAVSCARELGDLFCYNAKVKGLDRDRPRAVVAYERGVELAANDEERGEFLNRVGLEWAWVDPIDLDKAQIAFTAAMACGNGYAGSNLAHLLKRALAEPTQADEERINAGFRFAASKGNVRAMLLLADRLREGKGRETSEGEAGAWDNEAARHGSVPALHAMTGRHLEAGDAARAGVSAWLAGCEEEAGETWGTDDLVRHLASGRIGPARQDIVLALLRSNDGDDREADDATRLHRLVLEYNAAVPAGRDASGVYKALKALDRRWRKMERHAEAPGGDLAEKGALMMLLHRLEPYRPEIEALCRQLQPARRSEFFWGWFGGPLGWLLRPKPSAENRPDLRFGQWQ